MGIHSETPEQRHARLLDDEIRRLTWLRDDIDPTFSPVHDDKPPALLGRILWWFDFLTDCACYIFLGGLAYIVIALTMALAVWAVIGCFS